MIRPAEFPTSPSDAAEEAGLYERRSPDGWTNIWIVGHHGEELWTSRIRTDLVDADTRGILRAWASAQLRRSMRRIGATKLEIMARSS